MSDNEGGAGAPEAKNEPITIRVRDQVSFYLIYFLFLTRTNVVL
jgi:hypothetical protein